MKKINLIQTTLLFLALTSTSFAAPGDSTVATPSATTTQGTMNNSNTAASPGGNQSADSPITQPNTPAPSDSVTNAPATDTSGMSNTH